MELFYRSHRLSNEPQHGNSINCPLRTQHLYKALVYEMFEIVKLLRTCALSSLVYIRCQKATPFL